MKGDSEDTKFSCLRIFFGNIRPFIGDLINNGKNFSKSSHIKNVFFTRIITKNKEWMALSRFYKNLLITFFNLSIYTGSESTI